MNECLMVYLVTFPLSLLVDSVFHSYKQWNPRDHVCFLVQIFSYKDIFELFRVPLKREQRVDVSWVKISQPVSDKRGLWSGWQLSPRRVPVTGTHSSGLVPHSCSQHHGLFDSRSKPPGHRQPRV